MDFISLFLWHQLTMATPRLDPEVILSQWSYRQPQITHQITHPTTPVNSLKLGTPDPTLAANLFDQITAAGSALLENLTQAIQSVLPGSDTPSAADELELEPDTLDGDSPIPSELNAVTDSVADDTPAVETEIEAAAELSTDSDLSEPTAETATLENLEPESNQGDAIPDLVDTPAELSAFQPNTDPAMLPSTAAVVTLKTADTAAPSNTRFTDTRSTADPSLVISPDVAQLHLAFLDALGREPVVDSATFEPETGARFNEDGSLTLRVLVGNTQDQLTVIGDFNGWGTQGDLSQYQLHPTSEKPILHEVTLPPDDYHLSQYRLVDQNGNQRLDVGAALFSTPAFNARFYDDHRHDRLLNSVFWQSEPLSETERAERPDLRGQQLALLEADMASLSVSWVCPNPDSQFYGQTGATNIAQLYNFVTECGIAAEVADLGYNAIEFMPLDAHIDFYEPSTPEVFPDWRYSYQNFSLYSKHADFGSPDELKRMINAFHQADVAVILDVVYSHFANTGNNPPREFGPVGLAQYKRQDGSELYGGSWTEWGTRRFRYTPAVRQNIVEAALVNILDYGFDGLRLDNINGIDYEANGRILLRDLSTAVLRYYPKAVIIGEGYFGDPALNRSVEVGGAGLLTTYADRFYLWFTEQLLKFRPEVDIWQLNYILDRDWPKLLLYYPGNHDEFANAGNPFQARGRYLAEAIQGGYSHQQKIRSWSALNLFASSFYLDMFQMWTLQPGSLNTNAVIDWTQLQDPQVAQLVDFQADMKRFFTQQAAFAPYNAHRHMVRWIDDVNKIVVFERIDFTTNRHVYVVVNLGDQSFDHYRVYVGPKETTFAFELDSDQAIYGGGGRNAALTKTQGHWLDFALGSYGVTGLVQVDNLSPVTWVNEGDIEVDDLSGMYHYSYTPEQVPFFPTVD